MAKKSLTRTCSIEGCDKPHLAKGWCEMHHGRWRRNGDPLKVKFNRRLSTETPEERFWSLVKKDANERGCWEWQGGYSDKDYGIMYWHSQRGNRATHVISWYLHYGRWPELCICHRCDNPRCCNPDHLFEGTKGDNNRDRHLKGRTANGEKKKQSHLTATDIVKIRELASQGASNSSLSQMFKVSLTAISNIRTRTTWKHVK